MKQIKTLTLNGNTYEIADPDAAHIDDGAVGQTTWSSQAIVDRLCPRFTENGPAVTCRPVAGYPLEVTSRMNPVQAGEGTPSPDNVRPITGTSTVELTHNESPITAQLGQTVYGGSYNWHTGLLTIDCVRITLTGTEQWTTIDTNPRGTIFAAKSANAQLADLSSGFGISSHFLKAAAAIANSAPANSFYWLNSMLRICYGLPSGGTTTTEFNQFLAAEHEKGTPVEFVCALKTPVTVQLTPRQIPALAGENSLVSATGDTTVTGRADLPALLEALTAAQ